MKQLALAESLRTFQLLFQNAQSEMFKAEVLQDYTAVDDCPSLQAWLKGDKEQALALGKTDPNIIAYRKQCLKSSAVITRVHVIQQPYTPYLKWEIAVCYKNSLLAHNAETILLVSHERLAGIHLPKGDFWIFDNKQVLQWEYKNGNNETIGATIWDKSQGDTIEQFLRLKKTLLAVAKPL